MIAILWALVALSAAVVLVRHPRVSVVSLGGLGLLAYSIPALFGTTIVPETAELVSVTDTAVSLVILSWLGFAATVGFGASLYKPAENPAHGHEPFDISFLVAALVVFLTLFGVLIARLGPGLLVMGRYSFAAALAESTSLSMSWLIMKWAAGLGLVFGVQTKQWVFVGLFAICLALVAMLGDRTTPVITLAAALLVIFQKWRTWQALRHPAVWIGGLALVSAVFLIKPAYKSLTAGVSIGTVLSQERPVAILAQWEAFGTHAVLERIVATGFRFDWLQTLIASLGQLLIVPSLFGIESSQFNDAYQPQIFPDVTYGLAGNHLAQWYAMFGFFGAVASGVFYGSVLMLIDRWHQRAKGAMATLAIMIGSAFAVYQHRNGIENELAILRQIAIAFVAAWLLAFVLRRIVVLWRIRWTAPSA